MHKDILILAKSHKNGGFCVAGVEVNTNGSNQRSLTRRWIRPVCNDGGQTSGALPSESCRDFSVLDVVRFDLEKHSPMTGQCENWQWPSSAIRTVSTLPDQRVLGHLADRCGDIWHDSATPRDDQVSAQRVLAEHIEHSLMMITPLDLVFSLERQKTLTGVRKRVYCSFTHNGKTYRRIAVTDPVIFRVFSNQFPATMGTTIHKRLRHGDGYWLTLSLSPCFGASNYHYIVAATVIDHTGYLNRTYR
ncbi:MAG: hypothetical protein WC997_09340 [Porticoccaceae bacterium]